MYLNIIWLCAALALAICAILVYSVATFRTTQGSAPAAYRRSAAAEVLWALIPVAILVCAAAPAVRTLANQSDLTTKPALVDSQTGSASDIQAARP
jgi:cytochrome c oxidase subunit 2